MSTQPELLALAEELREFTAMRYAGDCKCGGCQLVPRKVLDRAIEACRHAQRTLEPTLREQFDSIITALNYDGNDTDSLTVGEIRRALP